ncbi:MAG TPA: hypothetical protein VK217_05975, partial [Acidimicrobiales bacterium]|nr:hypothetical protein [Acidimicrobiales bacterium]
MWLLPPLLLVLILATYPRRLNLRGSLTEYFNGVYRSRILGRELVLGTANGFYKLASLLGHRGPSGLMPGWFITNGCAFLATAWLLYWLTARRSPRLVVLYVATLVVVATSSAVVTPYDLLSYALIFGAFLVATSRDRRLIWSLGALLMALAVATRESALLIVPILAATLVPLAPPGSAGARTESWKRAFVAVVREPAVQMTVLVGAA